MTETKRPQESETSPATKQFEEENDESVLFRVVDSGYNKTCQTTCGSLENEKVHTSLKFLKIAFIDAYETICPVPAAVQQLRLLECPFYVGKIMEQCVARLDVAMFNAILRPTKDEGPTDPISDPISDAGVLPIPLGKASFGVLVMLLKDMLSRNKLRKENLIMVYFAAIVLPEQSLASQKTGLAVSKKGLTLKELLQQTSHHNAKILSAEDGHSDQDGLIQSNLKLNAFVKGPYGHESQYHLMYENLILVAGGIGISPFMAVLTDILNRIKDSKACMPRNVLIIWAVKISKGLLLLRSLDLNLLFPDFYTKLNLEIRFQRPENQGSIFFQLFRYLTYIIGWIQEFILTDMLSKNCPR
ncbi:ferric reduction oxidase 7, chloroplastic-like protein [Tanacetum coccineum]